MPVAAHPDPDLADHVEDRTAGERVEAQLEGAEDLEPTMAPRKVGPPPTRPAAPSHFHQAAWSRAGRTQPLGGVVQPEADDEDGRERDLARPGETPIARPSAKSRSLIARAMPLRLAHAGAAAAWSVVAAELARAHAS